MSDTPDEPLMWEDWQALSLIFNTHAYKHCPQHQELRINEFLKKQLKDALKDVKVIL